MSTLLLLPNRIELSADLSCEVIRHHLDFLREVDARGALFYDADFVANSVRRYELFWVPLVVDSCSGEEEEEADIMPPLDVHWVWHVHMLAPVR